MTLFTKLLLLISLVIFEVAAQKNSFKALCYHNVVDKITDESLMNITTDQLISHFKWLKENNYTVISIDDILRAKQGKKNLPKKSILLTFDDGYTSFYTRIYPLLKLYNYPAVYGLVGKWQNTPMSQNFLYGAISKSRKMLLTWEQIKEMTDSGLVEIGSHSFNAHYGILTNYQGNSKAFYTAIAYDKKTQQYETEEAYIKRVEEDIKKSSDTIFKHTGKRPRVMLWPYGAYNYTVQQLAKKHGMPISMTLDNGINTPDDLTAVKRILIANNVDFDDFFWNIQNSESTAQRALYVDPDEIYDVDLKKMDENLGLLIEKIRKFGASVVFVKGYADLDNDGLADMLYYPNKILPTRVDILGRILWQIKSRAGVGEVHAWMPISAFELNNKALSLYNINDKKRIKDIYYSLAKYSFFQGILFDNTYANNYRANSIIDFTRELEDTMKKFAMKHKTSIFIKADSPLLHNRDSYAKLLSHFDYTILNTKNILNSKKSMQEIVNYIGEFKHGLEKSAFVFDSKYYLQNAIADYMLQLTLNKAMNFGYSDNFTSNTLDPKEITKVFSLKSTPFE